MGSAAPGWSATPRTLVVCDDIRDPLTLDPQKQFSEKNHTVLQQIFDGLVRFGPAGQIEPALAVSWERLGPTVIRFRLRPNVVFHNGEPFDADSVKYTLERYLDPQTGFPALGFIGSVEKVEVVDPLTIHLITRYPDGLLLNRLAGFVVMVPPEYIRKAGEEGFAARPVGTGAFKFQSWEKGRQIELVRNENYWGPASSHVDRLVFKFLPMERQVEALLKGEVDILTSLPGTQTLDVQQNQNTYVIKKPSFYTIAGAFNICRGPLANRRVRQALNMAVDKKDLIRYDVLGNGIPLGTLTLPGEAGHNPDIRPYPYDPAAAKRILREEGHAEGFVLKAFVKANVLRTAKILSTHLERVGVKLDMTEVADAELFEYLKNRDQWDILLADCPDPMYSAFFIPAAFLSSQSPFSLCPNPALDERLGKIVGTLDPQGQENLFREMDDHIFNEALCLFTYQRIRTYGLRRGVRFTPHTSGMSYFHTVSFEEKS